MLLCKRTPRFAGSGTCRRITVSDYWSVAIRARGGACRPLLQSSSCDRRVRQQPPQPACLTVGVYAPPCLQGRRALCVARARAQGAKRNDLGTGIRDDQAAGSLPARDDLAKMPKVSLDWCYAPQAVRSAFVAPPSPPPLAQRDSRRTDRAAPARAASAVRRSSLRACAPNPSPARSTSTRPRSARPRPSGRRWTAC